MCLTCLIRVSQVFFLFLEHVTSQTPDIYRAHLRTNWLGPCAPEPACSGILPGCSLCKDIWPRGHPSVGHSQPSLQDPLLISSLLSFPTGGSISKYVLVFARQGLSLDQDPAPRTQGYLQVPVVIGHRLALGGSREPGSAGQHAGKPEPGGNPNFHPFARGEGH